MILAKGPDTALITKVKGHATEADVEQGRVRAEEKSGMLRLTLRMILHCISVTFHVRVDFGSEVVSRRVHGESSGLFLEPCTQVQGRGSCVHRDTASVICCMSACAWTDTSLLVSRLHHSHHNHHNHNHNHHNHYNLLVGSLILPCLFGWCKEGA